MSELKIDVRNILSNLNNYDMLKVLIVCIVIIELVFGMFGITLNLPRYICRCEVCCVIAWYAVYSTQHIH